jgi:RNA polymerase sigma factor (sigma-70 family)
MGRLRAGDRSELTFVFEALDGPVRALTRKMLGGGPDADDAAQEALMKVFASLDRYEDGRDPVTWALAVAGWECRTVRRRASRARTDAAVTEHVSASASPEEEAEAEELRAAIVEIRTALSPIDQETLDAVLGETGEGAKFRKRKERLMDRMREGLRRVYG